MHRFLISAAHKSSGKTTLSIGLAAALKDRGLAVQPFKKGPDYIDPLWLSCAASRGCRNLDFFLSSHEEIRQQFAHGHNADVCLVEGNKGLYDGLALDGGNSNAALARLLDGIHYCGHCAAENFHDPNAGSPAICWACQQPLVLPLRLRWQDPQSGAPGRRAVLLNHDTRLYGHHLDPHRRPYDFGAPLAEVVRHPADPGRWGLKNLGSDKWVMTNPDGALRDVEPGRSAGLAAGVRIDFGQVSGVVEG